MEVDLDETEHDEDMGAFEEDSGELRNDKDQPHSSAGPPEQHNPLPTSAPEWRVCGYCRPMPQEIENKCCRQKNCITLTSRFAKICLDQDVLELCIRNTGDIRNDEEDNSTQAFRKAGYRQFVLARHGHLGKGNRRVCPSCVVLKIRGRYPSVTGVYMGCHRSLCLHVIRIIDIFTIYIPLLLFPYDGLVDCLYPLTCPAWVTLPGAYAPAGIALGVMEANNSITQQLINSSPQPWAW
ncbi:P2X purinoceptor 7-like [Paramuricea clavata]|uniref:P2X purinoceptor 7-like n=1 Tax=Paramuricea clavata TaxID=317549 RepID=A0A6S7JKK3_PARCT|nr:P2X purinoceptor 7-like [Paramuricea clavata]